MQDQPQLAHFLSQVVGLDIETHGRRLDRVGVVRGVRELVLKAPLSATDIERLDAFVDGAPAIVGHNVRAHDLPFVARVLPRLRLLEMPAIDTLVLSPLGWPGRPFHRLVKPYKTTLEVDNDPVADARGSLELLAELMQKWARSPPVLLALYQRALRHEWGPAADAFFAHLPRPTGALDLVSALSTGACVDALNGVQKGVLDASMALAYAAAWTHAAADAMGFEGAVLPAWVRHAHPATVQLLDRLRDTPCKRDDCSWCRRHHRPEALLKRHFGFDGFRDKPATAAGHSLQKALVEAGLQSTSYFAALPTGAGKSLCFQLPALARFERRGLLTVVVSPLQSLMHDQVQALAGRTQASAAAIHGMLTAIERQDVLERVRMGDIGLLYLSPEQTRNRSVRGALRVREVAAWVFDEAHCLSKWGHDFRTDYLYVPRFVAELAREQGVPPPPVHCLTATAQLAVVEEICTFIHDQLGHTLQRFIATVSRDNLTFAVRAVPPQRRLQAIADELARVLRPGGFVPRKDRGSAIVFVRTRKNADDLALQLKTNGLWRAEGFHAGLDPADKRRLQRAFMAGEVQVMCATSAFGMGIDKDDVRLVVHDFLPGSLESYLQQAGRAGRDRAPAECVLLYDVADTEAQFRLASDSELRARDISALLRVVKRLSGSGSRELVVSHGELMRLSRVQAFDPEQRMASTQVNTAVSWLERARLLRRDENRTRVFQGRPQFKTLAASRAHMRKLGLKDREAARWEVVLRALSAADVPQAHDADDLAALAAVVDARLDKKGGSDPRFAGLALIRTLHRMADVGLLSRGIELSAWLTVRVKGASMARLEQLVRLEEDLWAVAEEQSGGMEVGQRIEVSIVRLNGALLERGHSCSEAGLVRALLRAMGADGRGMAGATGSLQLRSAGRSRMVLKLLRPWEQVGALARKRLLVGRVIVQQLLDSLEQEAPGARGTLLVEFALEDLVQAGRRNIALRSAILKGRMVDAVERALLYLHELEVLRLDRGLAVFRPAMTLRFDPRPDVWRYTRAHHAALQAHYEERTLQIHVMDAWARIAAEDPARADALARDWFEQPKGTFLRRWLPDARVADLQRRTTSDSYKRIVSDLKDTDQQTIVTWKGSRALLVLAGPGSGKSRVIVHRCAWLVRVQRVPPGSVLVLCYNRATALELRRRLRALIGEDARRVDVFTYHGLALRLVGRSVQGQPEVDFGRLLRDAAEVLRTDGVLPSVDSRRDRILAGYEHILVDEYQDIDTEQFELVSLVAGRTEKSPDSVRLRILAVGDDDQNIYAFRDTSTTFIRRFTEHYGASARHLLRNYRSSRHILDAAQSLIVHDPGRLKRGQLLEVDPARAADSPGGRFAAFDRQARGRVRLLDVVDARAQVGVVVDHLRWLLAVDPDGSPRDIAVLGRTRRELAWVRVALEAAGISHLRPPEREGAVSPSRLRAVARLLRWLAEDPQRGLHPAELASRTAGWPEGQGRTLVQAELGALADETDDALTTASAVSERLWEALAEAKAGAPVGQGIQLHTLHGVKGLEFPHVVILDGGFRIHSAQERADERRLLYVGMTRARDSLSLVRIAGGSHPLFAEINHPDVFVEARTPSAPVPAAVRFTVLGLGQLFLDLAGRSAPDAPIHGALERMKAGDPVRLKAMGHRVCIVDEDGVVVGALSKSADREWTPRLARVLRVEVVAVVERDAEQSGEAWRSRLRCRRWLVPVVEVRWR